MGTIGLRQFLNVMNEAPDKGIRHIWPGIPPISLRQLLKLLPPHIYPGLDRLEQRDVLAFDEPNAQGVAYGGGNIWFLSSRVRIFKYSMAGNDFYNPIRWTRLQEISLHNDVLPALRPRPGEFNHFGGIYNYKGVLFVPVQYEPDLFLPEDPERKTNPPRMLLSMTPDLQVLGYTLLDHTICGAWCAVNPWNGLLYMDPQSDSQKTFLRAFDVSGHFDRLTHPEHWGEPVDIIEREAQFYFRDQHGALEAARGIQGADFSPTGRLYVTPSSQNFGGDFDNDVRVFDVRTGIKIDNKKQDFSGLYDEIEGISICSPGVMYISVCLNASDEFHVYAFRFPTNDPL